MTQSTMHRRKVVILGGGTAGWMAANLMACHWRDQDFEITLLESPEIGIVGVGEGSTPQLKSFFDFIGVDESEWMPACNATFKNGISFKNWSTKPGFDQYFHPFPSQTDDQSAPAFFYNSFVRRKGVDVFAHPNRFFLSAHLAANKLGPKPGYNFPFKMGYGYHFDSSLVGQFLAKKAGERGVTHIEDKVTEVKLHDNGDIRSLQTEAGRQLEADLFVDCSGFAGILIQKTLKAPFKTFSNNLFNDAAVVMPTPQDEEIGSETVSTALSNGWAWEIPLINRKGNGYVYASAACSADQAEIELRTNLGLLDSDVEARHLKMKVGRLENHWHRNCLAVGLSQGFIEPLEATALHLVQETIQGFIEAYESGDFGDKNRQSFNQNINARFEAVRDYIVCHYRVNSRSDSEYWLANGNNSQLSDSLKHILNAWMSGANLTEEIERQGIGKYYPSMSWHCLLAGYGIFPNQEQLMQPNDEAARYKMHDIDDFIQRCALNFKGHRALLTPEQ